VPVIAASTAAAAALEAYSRCSEEEALEPRLAEAEPLRRQLPAYSYTRCEYEDYKERVDGSRRPCVAHVAEEYAGQEDQQCREKLR